ncbi:hypothetical protein EVAR_2995_1 [Eumeta japonica]|uniref:Uncharacterized protein n=1 Tax=Eumeta variegata TaxID=151549 RepID=A0A4C1STH6_EUMVA|nr:hypothetical protein EVAR_2995_1 [Eumeta japonica]
MHPVRRRQSNPPSACELQEMVTEMNDSGGALAKHKISDYTGGGESGRHWIGIRCSMFGRPFTTDCSVFNYQNQNYGVSICKNTKAVLVCPAVSAGNISPPVRALAAKTSVGLQGNVASDESPQHPTVSSRPPLLSDSFSQVASARFGLVAKCSGIV